MRRSSQRSFREELPRILEQRRLSLRALAVQVGVSQSHLSRIIRNAPAKAPTGELAGRIALALGLPEDYFPEFREAAIADAIRGDPLFRERVYRLLRSRR